VLAASTSLVERFETEVLTQAGNLGAVMDVSATGIDQGQQRVTIDRVILDVDSSGSQTHVQPSARAAGRIGVQRLL